MNSLKKSHKYFDNNQFINIEAVSVQHGMIKSLAYIINNKCAYASDAVSYTHLTLPTKA